MSGTNPFRRKTTQQSSHLPTGLVNNSLGNATRAETRIPPIDTDLPRSTKTKTGKTVRIISPHSATADGEYGMPQRLFSPPPTVSSPPADLIFPQSIEDDLPDDPFSADPDGAGGSKIDEGTLQNTLRNSGNVQPNARPKGAMPANPFRKTLAGQATEIWPDPMSLGSEGRLMEAESKTIRPHYDVEDFKKLLLTGEKSGSGVEKAVPPPVSFQNPAHVGDSSSNTDASSVSRQSIFEPVSGHLQESPRTSYESALSDEERQRLVGSASIASERIKPMTPRHRHGKLVKANTPQTVSFDDPMLSSSGSAMSAMAPKDRSVPEIYGKVEKPLPPLPSLLNTHSLTQDPVESTNNGILGTHLESEEPPSSSTPQKRSPPPPPLSRRHSQLRSKHFSSTTERSMPIQEDVPAESALLSQSPPFTGSKFPPPPPPRRAGLTRGNSSSSISTGASSTPMSDQSNTADIIRSEKSQTPIPPKQSPSVSSVKRPNQTRSIPISPSVPPPPPPRRRGSSQSSYTPSRLSGNYTDRLRSDSGASSVSHLAMTPVSPSGAENKDVMADLSALQREVDELRGKFKD